MKIIQTLLKAFVILVLSVGSGYVYAQNKVIVVPLLGDDAAQPVVSSQLLGGASGFNGFGDGSSNFMPIGASQRTNNFDGSKVRIGLSGTMTSFFGGINASIMDGESYLITLVVNGVDQLLSCTINGAAQTTCTDLLNCVEFSEGDEAAVKFVGVGNPNNRFARWTGVFTPGASCL